MPSFETLVNLLQGENERKKKERENNTINRGHYIAQGRAVHILCSDKNLINPITYGGSDQR